jgi:integrase
MAHQDPRDLADGTRGRGYAARVSLALPAWLGKPSPRVVDAALAVVAGLAVLSVTLGDPAMDHRPLLGVLLAVAAIQPVRIPQPRRKRAIRPLAPETIERMRALLLARGRVRAAALLSVMGYAGLRPGEALALTWDCVGERSLIVEHGLANGELKETKTQRIRTVGLLAPVAEDLRRWRRKAPRRGALIFPRSDGAVFRDTDYRNWRKREFHPAASAAGVSDATPYTLRHSFASLLVQAGWNALEIAVEMGNSPEVVQRDYSHLLREFARGREIDPAVTILEARKAAKRTTLARS